MDEPAGGTRRDHRIPDIAWLKGLCIIGVLLIHSQPLVHSLAYEYVISRAVLIFIVLFGVTSELWWQRHAAEPWRRTAAAWYRTRLVRLMIPLWGMLALWWLLVITLRPPIHVAPHIVVATALGYMPWIGTGWFVTLALELVVLFPALRWCVHRVGGRVSLVVAAAVLVASYVYMYPIIHLMRLLLHDSGGLRLGGELFYYRWIFAPAYFFGVVAGMAIARNVVHLGAAVVPSAVALGLGVLVRQYADLDQRMLLALTASLDVPLTVLLLAAMPAVRLAPLLARALAWLGDASWGIYLGQTLIHDGLHAFGFEPEETAALAYRWLYFAILLTGSVALVHIGNAARGVLARDR